MSFQLTTISTRWKCHRVWIGSHISQILYEPYSTSVWIPYFITEIRFHASLTTLWVILIVCKHHFSIIKSIVFCSVSYQSNIDKCETHDNRTSCTFLKKKILRNLVVFSVPTKLGLWSNFYLNYRASSTSFQIYPAGQHN